MTSTIVFRIRSYVSVITEKYKLPFQQSSDNDCGETNAYQYSKMQQYYVPVLMIFWSEKSCLKYVYGFQCWLSVQLPRKDSTQSDTTVLYITEKYSLIIDQLISKTFHLEDKYPSWRKIEMGGCSSPVTAVTRPVHPKSSYLLVPASAAKRKNTIDGRKKYKRENTRKQTIHRAHISLSRKVTVPIWPAPVKLLIMLSSPSCCPSRLLLLRWSRELLANSCLYRSGGRFFLVVYHDV